MFLPFKLYFILQMKDLTLLDNSDKTATIEIFEN